MIRLCLATVIGALLLTAPAVAADADGTREAGAPAVTAGRQAASRGPVLPVLYGSLVGLQVYDGWSTLTAVKHGGVEANPVIGRLASDPGGLWAMKAVAATGSIWAAESLWRRHHRAQAIATMAAVNGIMLAVAAHNASVVGGFK